MKQKLYKINLSTFTNTNKQLSSEWCCIEHNATKLSLLENCVKFSTLIIHNTVILKTLIIVEWKGMNIISTTKITPVPRQLAKLVKYWISKSYSGSYGILY